MNSGPDRFEIGEPLGEGGFGRTFVARDRDTDTSVVLKRLHVRGLPSWKPVEHFEREVKVLRSLSHAGIPEFVDAFEVSDDDGVQLTIVVEHVPGASLAECIERGDRWDESQATALFRALLETLSYLHELSPPVIHRDIKPGNIVVRPDGAPVLVDFGSVRDLAAPQGGAMTVLGTPGFMAPEQSLGVSDARSDLYGLGATMLNALTHRPPVDLPRQDLRFDFDRIDGLPPTLVAVLARMVDPDPGRRWPSARRILDALTEPAAHQPSGGAAAVVVQRPSTALALADDEREVTTAVRRKFDFRSAVAASATGPVTGKSVRRIAGGTGLAVAGCAGAAIVLGPAGFAAALPLSVVGLFGLFVGGALRTSRRNRRLFQTGAQTVGRLVSARQGQQGVFIDYAYTVDDVRYEGVSYTSDVTVTNSIRSGMAVLVRYAPGDPSESVGLLGSELDSIRAANG